MTKAQAQILVADLVSRDVLPVVTVDQSGTNYTIHATKTGARITSATMTTIATANGVTAQTDRVEFV